VSTNFAPERCAVSEDEIRHDELERAQTIVYERCLSMAQDEFNLGMLDECDIEQRALEIKDEL